MLYIPNFHNFQHFGKQFDANLMRFSKRKPNFVSASLCLEPKCTTHDRCEHDWCSCSSGVAVVFDVRMWRTQTQCCTRKTKTIQRLQHADQLIPFHVTARQVYWYWCISSKTKPSMEFSYTSNKMTFCSQSSA